MSKTATTTKMWTPISLQPITWKDKLLLLSPITWFGFVHQLHRSPFVLFRIEHLLQSIVGLLLPLLVLTLSNKIAISSCRHLMLSLSSPWTYGIVTEGIIPPVKQIWNTAHVWKCGRQNPITTNCFEERIRTGRCIRCSRFDVFLPTRTAHAFSAGQLQQQQQQPLHALLLLPGALIAHTAYSDVAARLSDHGICVVVVSMEPCRMASKYLGASPRRLKNIMNRVDTTILPQPATFWSIGGHSLGSFAAMAAAKEFGLSSSSLVSSLVLWGSPNLPNTRTNLRHSSSTMRVLVLQGSEDKLCYMDDTRREEFLQDLPSLLTHYQTIDGAGHNWFASVDAGDPNFLGHPTITMEQQQDDVVNITAAFIFGTIGAPHDL